VFIGEILANMTQVSDVAPGPLVLPYSTTSQLYGGGQFLMMEESSQIL
jgi:hypothetical protein